MFFFIQLKDYIHHKGIINNENKWKEKKNTRYIHTLMDMPWVTPIGWTDKEFINKKKEIVQGAKELYQKDPDDNSYFYVQMLNDLASTYNKRERIHEAIILGEKALSIIQKYRGSKNAKPFHDWNHLYFVGLLNLSYSYERSGNIDRSIKLKKIAENLNGSII